MPSSSTLRRHPHRGLLEWLSLGLVLLALGTGLAYFLNESRSRIDAREKERLTQQCKVVGMNLGRQFGAINSALAGIVGEVPSWRRHKDGQSLADQYLRALNNAMPGVLTFIVLDAAGNVEASDRPELVGKNFAHRDYFQEVVAHPGTTTLYVRPPFISVRGNFTMNLVRMVSGPHGQFDGLVIAALDTEEFKVLLDSVIYRSDIRASLIHGDGIPFLMAPHSMDADAIDLAKPGGFFDRHVKSGRKTNLFTGPVNFVGDERMVALQTIQDPALSMDKPMVIAVDRTLQSLHAGWKQDVLRNGLWFALLALSSGFGLALLQRRRRHAGQVAKEEEAARQLVVEALRRSENRFRSLTRLSSDWYWEQDNQFRFVRLSGELDPITKTANAGHIGKTRWEMGALNLTEADWDAHRAALKAHQEFHDFEMLRRDKDGNTRWTSVSGTPIFDPQGTFTGYCGVAKDITENKLAQESIKHLAFYDNLTQLPNRRLLKDRLATAFAASKRSRRYGALMVLDLDNFKPLNDSHGHEVGDLLLMETATRLKTCVREIDTVARFGGDEFVVIVNELDWDKSESIKLAGRIAEKIRARLAQPYVLKADADSKTETAVEHRCTVSIGVTLFLGDGANEVEVLRFADAAMYQAKVAGRDRFQYLDSTV
jgi:diguanylate cyclase (GGDEF)-like protein/PAS domain S-box-containing protein